ncbi:MAG: rubredoxin [Nitrospirota bacterium]
MTVAIQKIPGGFSLDGLELKSGKCGCTSISTCCYSWSKIKKRDDRTFEFVAKTTTPETSDFFTWGYTATREGVTVTVLVEDARDKKIYSGYLPPAAGAWEARGWTIAEKNGEREDGAVWRCASCRWLYKEDREGAPFASLPDDWKCPVCNVGKEAFESIG